ncbi:MAG: extracellular solute-binding protein, partial [Clostridia bacterium]|nr:extracellular solute-binding protein [Clostridia bacterium]
LKVRARDYTGGLTNYNNCALTKWIEKNLNIKLQFTTCGASETSTKMTLAYASGSNPYDIYMGMAPIGNFHNSYIKQGKVTKLDKLIDTYGPNIKKMFEEFPEAQYICTNDNGSIYMLPMINDRENYCDLIYINKDWLKAVDKSLPTTTDDFKKVLEAFKKHYPSKTPFMTNSNAGSDIGPSLFGPFGISTYHNWQHIDQKTDTIKSTVIDDKYRTALRYYNGLYSAGLMKMVASRDDIMKATEADTVGAFLNDDWSKCVSAENFNDSWTLVPVLNAKTGGTWANVVYENTWAEWFLVTASCKYPEIAVRLADWFYSTEGTIASQYGPKGTFWDYDKKGNIVLNDSKVPSGKTTGEYLYTLTPSYCLPRYMGEEYNSITFKHGKETEITKASNMYNNLIKTLIKPNAEVKYKYPHLNQTEDEAKLTAGIESSGQYTYQMRVSFITGTKSLDSDWDSYVKTMKNTYKIDTSIKVANTQYKRYKAWLATQ